MKKIKVNKVKCLQCDDVIESVYRHDFVWCKCGAIAVDGGKDYLKRIGEPDNYQDLSEYVKCPDCQTVIKHLSSFSNPYHPLFKDNKPFNGIWYCPKCNKEYNE